MRLVTHANVKELMVIDQIGKLQRLMNYVYVHRAQENDSKYKQLKIFFN
jgi:hypothetical protein